MSGASSSRRRSGSSWHNSFSRLFTRSASQEQQEGAGKAAPEQEGAHSFAVKENYSTGVACRRKESSPLPEILTVSVCDNKNLSTEEVIRSTTQDELKKAISLPSLVHDGKPASNVRPVKEGFFQFLGSLFGISSKSSWRETEPCTLGDGYKRMESDFASPNSYQERGHIEQTRPDPCVISTPESGQGALNKDKEVALVQGINSNSQNLRSAQEQPAEAVKKTEGELVAPAVTYATYRGSARIKQLLKKQAKLEQETETPSSINSTTVENKENGTVSLSNSETVATKSSLKGNIKQKTKDDDIKNEQANIILAKVNLETKTQHVLNSSEKELQNAITSTEMETIKNCTKELVSVKHASFPNIPGVSKNLLLEPILLPKEANSSCQNIDTVRISSENSRLVENGEMMQIQLESDSSTIVGFKKGMDVCAFSDKETKQTMPNDFLSHSKVDCTDHEQQLLDDKHSCYQWPENQLKLNKSEQILSLSTVCSGQASNSIINGSEDSLKSMVEDDQNLQVISPNAHLPLLEQRPKEEFPLVVQDVECNKTKKTTTGVDLVTSAQSAEFFQDSEKCSTNGLMSAETIEPMVRGDTQNNPNVRTSKTETQHGILENSCLPSVEYDSVQTINILPIAAQVNHGSTAASAKSKSMESFVACTSPEIADASTGNSMTAMNRVPLISEGKDSNYYDVTTQNTDKTRIKSIRSEDVPSPEDQTKTHELEKTRVTNNTGCAVIATSVLSPLGSTEVMVNSPVISAEKNDPFVHETKNHYEVEMTPALDVEQINTIGLSLSSAFEDVCLPKDCPVAVKPKENNSSAVHSSPSVPVLVANSFIFEDKISLDNISKLLPSSEDQNLLETSCFSFDTEGSTSKLLRDLTVVDSAEVDLGKICFSTSPCENTYDIKKSEVHEPLSPLPATVTGSADQISDPFLKSSAILNFKEVSDIPETVGVRSDLLVCSEDAMVLAGLCSMDSGSHLVKEGLPVSTSDDVYTCQPPPDACFKEIPKLCSPACETIDVLGKINCLSISPKDNNDQSFTNPKSKSLFHVPTSEATCPAPCLASIDYEVAAVEPVKMVLEMTFTSEQGEKSNINSSDQINIHCLAAATSKNTVEMADQGITTMLTKPSIQFPEEMLKGVETGKQVEIRSQDLTILFKKADEIVDAVLHLAIEEIQSQQAAGICQTNDIKDNLLDISLQKDQKTRRMLSESKDLHLRNSSLKHLNENLIRKFSGVKIKEAICTTEIQDEEIPFDITDNIDLHSSLVLKAKEITDYVINAAKENLTCNQHRNHLSLGQNIVLGSENDASERLSTDAELTAKSPEIMQEPRNVNSTYCDTIYNVVGECDIPKSSKLLYRNIKKGNKEVTSEEMVLNNVSSPNGGECSDATALLDSVATENSANSKNVNGRTHVADVSDKPGKWTASNQSEPLLYTVNGEIVTTEEQLPACQSLPQNVPTLNSKVDTQTCLSSKSNDQTGPLNLFQSSKGEAGETAAVVRKEPHGKGHEIGERGEIKNAYIVSQESDEFGTQFNMSDSAVTHSSAKTDWNSDFDYAIETIIDPGLAMTDMLMESYQAEDGGKSSECFALSPAEEWEGNSSFTILYEGALQDEGDDNFTEELKSAYPYEDNPLNEMLDNTCSESFMTAEAKRYKIYPFSLSPIYEDDSSQEDLLSTDVSPGGHWGDKSSGDRNQSLSILSLLQSVSERLQSNNQCSEEEEFCEENKLGAEKEVYFSSDAASYSSIAALENIHEGNLPSRCSHFLSKEALSMEEALSFKSIHSTQLLQKSDLETKGFSRNMYHDYLQCANSYSDEKRTKFGSMLLPKDKQLSNYDSPKSGAFQVCCVDRGRLKCNPRPGKMVIYDVHCNKNKHDIYHDVLDATTWVFSNEVLIRVVRGCWILYEKPEFQGQKYIVEESEKLLNDIWNPHSEKHERNFAIGSIRRVVKDCCVPEIELYPESSTDNFPICIQNAVANLEELEVKNATLSVKAGLWLAYSDANYKGEMMVWEEDHSPCEISALEMIKSLHPLKTGGLKVQMPTNIKMIIYERPHFEGWCQELSENIDCVPALFRDVDEFQGIGSIHVIGGIWVAYEKERYKGQQYLLEEGEYEDWQSWGGLNNILQSFRFLQADFIESEITLFEMDEENGKLLDIINQEISDLEHAGFGLVTRSINVKSGVWVAYQQKYFCGEQYILEKGKYKCFFDWGGSSDTLMSIRPIKLEPLGDDEPTHWLKAFSNSHFQGSFIDLTTETSHFADFTPCSFKVLRGCWLLHYQGETADHQCVLEEGLYTDLASCGCPAAAIKALQPVEYVFAEPFISLFALENCEGRELHLQEAASSVLSKELHFFTQSVWVKHGQWIAYEGSHFLGKQFLLEPSKISNWTSFSGLKVIGSLRPVKQPAVYFRIKNRSQAKYLTVAGNLMDPRATSVCLSSLNGKNTQIWHYRGGLIKSKVNDACLDVIGGKDVPGAKVALWVQHGKARQKWTVNEDGTISSYLSDQLVLDIKGGCYYDRNHVVVNQLEPSECTQKWDFEIL